MQEYVVNRPDEGAMEQALRENPGNAAGTVLRLAWQAGLLRDEIQHLTWEQVDFVLSFRTGRSPLGRSCWTGSGICGMSGTEARRRWSSPIGTGSR